MPNTVPIDIVTLTEPLPYREWLKKVTSVYVSEQASFADYNEYVTQWYTQKNNTASSHEANVKEMYVSFLKDISLNYTTVEEKRFLLNIDFNNPRDVDIILPFFSKKIKQIAKYHTKKREEIVQSSFRNTIKGSDFGVEVSIKKYILSLLSDEAFTTQFNISPPDISKIGARLVVNTQELYETDQVEYDLDTRNLDTAVNTLSTLAANVEDIDPLLFLDIAKLIVQDLKKCDVSLTTSDCASPLQNKVTQSNDRISINTTRTDWNQLPLSSFVGGEKSYDNLNYHYQKQLITKFTGSTYYYISTDSTGTASMSGVLFEPTDPHKNILNRYYPGHLTVPAGVDLKTLKQIGGFFIPSKTGLLTFASYSPSYSIDTSSLKADTIYAYPDPSIYGPGRGLSKYDQTSPVSHTENVNWVKHDKSNGQIAGDIISDEILPRFNAYQSREESTEFQPSGLSKYYDSIDFWTGDTKNIWANEDLYPTKPLHDLPIQARLDDLLIGDETVHEWRTDIYGNEFALYKSAHAKRVTTGQASGDLLVMPRSGIISDITTGSDVTDVSGTWFTIPDTAFYSGKSTMFGKDYATMLDTWPRYGVHQNAGNLYLNSQSISSGHEAIYFENSTYIVPTGCIRSTFNTTSMHGILAPTASETYIIDVVVTSDYGDDDFIGIAACFDHIPGGTQDNLGYTNTKDRFAQLSIGIQCGGVYSASNAFGAIMQLPPPSDNPAGLATSIEQLAFQSNSIATLPPERVGATWGEDTIRIRVEKYGDIITAWCSDWGSNTSTSIPRDLVSTTDHELLESTKFTINIKTMQHRGLVSKTLWTDFKDSSNYNRSWKFNTTTMYGLASWSQKGSHWTDINITVPDLSNITKYKSTPDALTTDKDITSRNNSTFGTIYVRNGASTVIDPISSALSGVFLKYHNNTVVMNEINNNVLNFDIIKDVIFLETSNYLIIEKYKFNYTTDKFTTILSRKLNLSRFYGSPQKISEVKY